MNWASPLIPAWLQGIGAILAVTAAYFAYRQLQEQIHDTREASRIQLDQSERQHRQTIESQHRPLVVALDAIAKKTFHGSPAVYVGHRVQVTVKNQGPGVALNVEISGWLRQTPMSLVQGLNAAAILDAEKATIDLDAPQFRLRLALGPGEEHTEWMAPANGTLPAIARPPALYYIAFYKDIFENKFPSKPRAEWFAGHHLILNWDP